MVSGHVCHARNAFKHVYEKVIGSDFFVVSHFFGVGSKKSQSFQNFEDCFKKQNEIIEEVSMLFKNAKTERRTLTHTADKSGKSKVHAYTFSYSSGDNGGVDCNDYSKKIKKKYGWIDNLRVYVMSSEFSEWLRNEAYN